MNAHVSQQVFENAAHRADLDVQNRDVFKRECLKFMEMGAAYGLNLSELEGCPGNGEERPMCEIIPLLLQASGFLKDAQRTFLERTKSIHFPEGYPQELEATLHRYRQLGGVIE